MVEVYRFIDMMWTPEFPHHEGCCQRSCQLCARCRITACSLSEEWFADFLREVEFDDDTGEEKGWVRCVASTLLSSLVPHSDYS